LERVQIERGNRCGIDRVVLLIVSEQQRAAIEGAFEVYEGIAG